jgi:hypothetical protein
MVPTGSLSPRRACSETRAVKAWRRSRWRSLKCSARPSSPQASSRWMLALAGIVGELLQGGRPDLAPRGVDDAQEGGVVLRVGDQAQIGHQVLHLGAGEERGPAAQDIGDVVLAQGLLEGACLMVAAIEDGDVAEVGPSANFRCRISETTRSASWPSSLQCRTRGGSPGPCSLQSRFSKTCGLFAIRVLASPRIRSRWSGSSAPA